MAASQDMLVLQLTFPTGVVRELYPILHPDVSVEVQARELRQYIYHRLAAARYISVEVATEAGEAMQQVIPVENIGSIGVLVRKLAPRDRGAFRVEPRHLRRPEAAGYPAGTAEAVPPTMDPTGA